MRSERVEFNGHNGTRLAARLDLPVGPVRASAVFAHCFTCSKDIAAARRIAGKLAACGIAVLRFDFTGLGHSAGEFANTNFSSNVADLILASKYLERRGLPPQLMIGHSLGGAAVIKAAPEVASVRAVATIGAPADPAHIAQNFGGKLDAIRKDGAALVTLAGKQFEIRRQFIDDIEASSLEAALAQKGRALLVLHAPGDAVVGIENAGLIFGAAKHPKSFVTLDDADHLLSREEDAEYAAEVIAAWSQRYLILSPETVNPATPEGVVRVVEVEPGGFRQDVLIDGKHQLVADEPAAVGGTDRGPSPYQLLSAALGTCTSMTLRLYARHKNIPLSDVVVDVTHNRCHAEDCGASEVSTPAADLFNRRIRLGGDLTEEQRGRLLAIADRCPVHRTLEGHAVIKTELRSMPKEGAVP
ncbi:MAG: alpha/beta fold hydrolase [Rhodobacteraceae bacterium]|nr:alpha/beta fold hydrolase [Paracoccaceae bacterium]